MFNVYEYEKFIDTLFNDEYYKSIDSVFRKKIIWRFYDV